MKAVLSKEAARSAPGRKAPAFEQVECLVEQEADRQLAGAEDRGPVQGAIDHAHAVVPFVTRLETPEHRNGVGD